MSAATASEPRPASRRRWLSYQREQTLSQLVIATLPLLLFSVLMLRQVAIVVGREADTSTLDAASSVTSILGGDASDLQSLLDSYATWDVLRANVAADDERDIHSSVIDFQVGQGSVDAAVLLIGSHVVAAGPPAVTAALAAALRQGTGASPTGPALGPVYEALGGGLYLVAVDTVDLAGRTGPGVDLAGGRPVAMAFGRQLDSRFVVTAKRLANVDLAVFNAAGTVLAASDSALAERIGPVDVSDLVAGTSVRQSPPDVVEAITPLVDGTGRNVGAIVVTGDLAIAGILGSDLGLFLAASLAVTLILSVILTVFLSRRLQQRLRPIGSGIAAVARGDLTVRLPDGERDEFERLAGSHNRLAAALEHRDDVIWQSVDALDNLRPDRRPARLATDVAAAARAVFRADGCRLVDGDGLVRGAAPRPAMQGAPQGTVAARARIWRYEDAPVLECWSDETAGWSSSERALFALFARQAGVIVRDAGLFEETSQRVERLGRSNDLQRDFLRGVSHNLQTPLTRILVISEALVEQPGENVEAAARAIHADADRLAHVVRQLLTVSRLDAGAYEPAADIFLVAPLVRRVWEALGTARAMDLIDQSGEALAVADRGAVEQVLWILLDNAVRYAPAGTVHVIIEARARSQPSRRAATVTGHELLVRVRDDGAGVPAAERQLIFERFRRGSNAAGQDGTGLGLDVARGLLQAMRGRIWYEQGQDAGATFAFTIPAEVATAPV